MLPISHKYTADIAVALEPHHQPEDRVVLLVYEVPSVRRRLELYRSERWGNVSLDFRDASLICLDNTVVNV